MFFVIKETIDMHREKCSQNISEYKPHIVYGREQMGVGSGDVLDCIYAESLMY